MFEIGEVVSYGATGLCTIEDIRLESLTRSGTRKQTYYILRPMATPTCMIYVPVDNAEQTSQMRCIYDKAQIDALLLSVKGQRLDWIEDTRRRADSFGRIVAQGIGPELLKLIACLYLEKKSRSGGGRKFCATDEKLLSSAERIVSEEFAYALQIPQKQVTAYIAERMGNGTE